MKRIFILLAMSFLVNSPGVANSAYAHDSRLPRSASGPSPYVVPPKPMEPKNVPDYSSLPVDAAVPAQRSSSSGTVLRSDLQSTTVPVETRLKLIVEYAIDAKTSVPGDIFEAHVKDDIFYGRALILPRGSLVRGRVVEITKPRLISRAAKIGLKLDQITTPTGDVIPLDAALEFQKGKTNKAGQLDPGTNFGTRVGGSVRAVAGFDDKKGTANGALVAANVATLGAPIVATAIGSSAIALFKSGDNVSIRPGEELEILLTNDLGLQIQ